MDLFAFSQTTQAVLALLTVAGMFVLFLREVYPTEVVAIGGVAMLLFLGVLPYEAALGAENGHLVRVLAFGALTVWTAFAIGIQRRGVAALMTLGFALFIEVILVNIRPFGMPAILSANLGIVLAYCGLQLYSFALDHRQPAPQL